MGPLRLHGATWPVKGDGRWRRLLSASPSFFLRSPVLVFFSQKEKDRLKLVPTTECGDLRPCPRGSRPIRCALHPLLQRRGFCRSSAVQYQGAALKPTHRGEEGEEEGLEKFPPVQVRRMAEKEPDSPGKPRTLL
ncbi:hypothetical protein Q5P01_017643 [Channa striata]|uniref:Uncharacterized protein n=1 Tax=Channa striata TaxID=64152 RepID=A0AA88M9S7_CHASR|nr:hypothetical protein Q5P01_017643 [Channa striata]